MFKYKIRLIVSSLILSIATINLLVILVIQSPIYKLNSETNNLIKLINDNSVNQWVSSLKSTNIFKDKELVDSNIIEIFRKYSDQVNIYNSIPTNFIKLIPLTIVSSDVEKNKEKIRTHVIYDENFPAGYKYIKQIGDEDINEYYNIGLKFENRSIRIKYKNKNIFKGEEEIIVQGIKSTKNIKATLQLLYKNSIQFLKDNNINSFKEINYLIDNKNFIKIGNFYNLDYILSSSQSSDVNFNIENNILSPYIPIAILNINQSDCKDQSIEIIYDISTKSYKLKDINSLFEKMCEPKITSKFVNQLKCNNCLYSPIDKTTQIYSSYIPKLENINLMGGGTIIHDANISLTNLFNDAKIKGITLNVVSSYRSYSEQQKTFAFWNSFEVQNGANANQALQLTTLRVAPPGHSEHQLGTAVDLGCAYCDKSSTSYSNKLVYSYLEDNAYRFGFILSYPRNSESITGYRYEPWHIRYIGIDLAKEFYNTSYTQGKERILSSFLKIKGLYVDQ